MPDPCPKCGRDRVLVGMRHNCVEREVRLPVPPRRVVEVVRPVQAAPVRLARAKEALASVPGYMAGARIRDVDRRRAYMRDYMRKRRSKGG